MHPHCGMDRNWTMTSQALRWALYQETVLHGPSNMHLREL
jgi:hypothetical protein